MHKCLKINTYKNKRQQAQNLQGNKPNSDMSAVKICATKLSEENKAVDSSDIIKQHDLIIE